MGHSANAMRIILIEDDRETADFVQDGLKSAGHDVAHAADGTSGLARLEGETFDVAIVDRLLPGLDGISIVKRMRAANTTTRVIFLTTLAGIHDRVEGLEAGGDDYLIKPFAFVELLARVNALGRRTSNAPVAMLRVADLELDLIKRKTVRAGVTINLQPMEFKLLETLMRQQGRVFTKSMLLERVWNFRFNPQTTLVETHVSRLRGKIDRDFPVQLIETMTGGGYRIRDPDAGAPSLLAEAADAAPDS